MIKQYPPIFLYLGYIALLLLFSPGASAQYGPFKYCCDIQKCLNVISVCAVHPTCAAACLASPNSTSSTTPSSICQAPAVQSLSYSCFISFLTPSSPNSSFSVGATTAAPQSSPPPSLIQQVCNQVYDPAIPPASQALMTYGQCRVDCAGWDLLVPDAFSLSGSVALLTQYILPVVVFCTTIPRRQRWNVPDAAFDMSSGPIWLRVPRVVIGFLLGALIIITDMTVWVIIVIVAAGPIFVGGMIEGWIDFKIIRALLKTETAAGLTLDQHIELIVVLLCGNLDPAVAEAYKVINEALVGPVHDQDLQSTQAQLKSILRAQSTFGSLVGAPIVFFIGAFGLTLQALSTNIGDNKTAHNLAFGMWWTVIVQVAIVSSCMLASNNPATVVGIVASSSLPDTASSSRHRPSITTLHGRNIPRNRHVLGMPPIFEPSFMPVTLWDRGKVKRAWLKRGEAWKGSERIWEMVELRGEHWFVGWVAIPVFAFTLIFVPAMMAFTISYTTPKVCVSCRSFVFLMYAVFQLVLIIANTWSTYNPNIFWNWISTLNLSPRHSKVPKWQTYSKAALNALGQFTLRLLVVIILLVSFLGALLTSFVGTTLELLGTFGNCLCSIPIWAWSIRDRDLQTFNLALDTAEHRDNSKYWSGCGYGIIVFILVVTYAGWWYQKWLRKCLVEVIECISNVWE